mgnify:CR=1 FL=1
MNTGDRERITFLVANYNHAEYIGDCIASIKAQADTRWLAIVCDDGSTDHSPETIRSLIDERFQFVECKVNRGYIFALRKLIERATTDIVAIVDADDAISPETTGSVLDAFATNPHASLVYSRFAVCDSQLNAIEEHGQPVPKGGTAIVDGPVGHIKSFRKSAYEKTAGLDDEFIYAEDRDLIYKLEEVGELEFVNKVLYRYRKLPDSQSHDPDKREIGVRNTRRARRAALSRRDIGELYRMAAEWMILWDYVESSYRFPGPVRACASVLAGKAATIWRRGDMLARAGV